MNNGEIINLNSLEKYTEEDYRLVKASKELRLSNGKNDNFLEKASKVFSVSKISRAYGITWYKLESNIILICSINEDTLQLLGNYPLHYIKLLYRYIKSL